MQMKRRIVEDIVEWYQHFDGGCAEDCKWCKLYRERAATSGEYDKEFTSPRNEMKRKKQER